MSARHGLILAVLLLSACGGADRNDLPGADTLTQAQRDSIIGASRLPGAGAVQRALDASEATAARNPALDSID